MKQITIVADVGEYADGIATMIKDEIVAIDHELKEGDEVDIKLIVRK